MQAGTVSVPPVGVASMSPCRFDVQVGGGVGVTSRAVDRSSRPVSATNVSPRAVVMTGTRITAGFDVTTVPTWRQSTTRWYFKAAGAGDFDPQPVQAERFTSYCPIAANGHVSSTACDIAARPSPARESERD